MNRAYMIRKPGEVTEARFVRGLYSSNNIKLINKSIHPTAMIESGTILRL